MTERSGLSRRQALKYGGLAATAPLLAAMRPAGKTSPVNLQSNWRWCHRCQGLWFAGDGTGGVCPARGFHSLKGSGDYFLTQGSGSGQDNWRWCHRCQGLWFAGSGTGGVCPARGFHSLKGSGDYFLL